MKRRAEKARVRQVPEPAVAEEVMRQAVLRLVAGVVGAKQLLLEWVQAMGLRVLEEVLADEAVALAGPKGKHQADRAANHWGTAAAELVLGGRKIRVQRPRVRSREGRELPLPSVLAFGRMDPLPKRVLQQIVLGVTTRGYEASLERAPSGVVSRGTSRSAVSRHLCTRMRGRLTAALSRDLSAESFLALMLDGIVIAEQSILVALGITADGSKKVLGLRQGTTENSAVCSALLGDLLERGLRVQGRLLVVLDGAKGLRKAVQSVFGEQAVVQRCQFHKRRNVVAHLPELLRARVDRLMREAYAEQDVALARRRLQSLHTWLDREGHQGAAASLQEGLEETLTVVRLRLPATLRRTLRSTNPIENLLGAVRRLVRRIKRWRGGDMVYRWSATALFEAEQRFRRIKGHDDLPKLAAALLDLPSIDAAGQAA